MNQLKCEMCGSTDLVKQDGLFVCQVCGTKYSVEEAKKMMIEGTVDVSGSTVKVDISAELANLYKAARRARDDNNKRDAIEYYEKILKKDPTSWEASFYVVYMKALSTGHVGTFGLQEWQAMTIKNCIKPVLGLIADTLETEEERVQAIREISERCTSISNEIYSASLEFFGRLVMPPKYAYKTMIAECSMAKDIMYTFGDTVVDMFQGIAELQDIAIAAWKNGVEKHSNLIPYFKNQQTNQDNRDIVSQYISKIQKYEPTYQPPEIKAKAKNGCYIATCVYGSYDCPEVWTLRRYRDNMLGSTRRGRAFIRCYYAVSPTVVKWFGHANWFHKFWRKKLDKKVRRLREQGVEDTPYEDIEWRKK